MSDWIETEATACLALAGGCFWCIEGIFAQLRGVLSVESGYSNGLNAGPVSYEAVCTGRTGHAEVILLHYDPQVISCQQLLEVFFAVHDPSQLNRQGADVGTQYRSGIYTTTPEQTACAQAAIAQLRAQGVAVVTEVAPLTHYCRAEDEHQNYFARHPQQPYCQAVAAPKMRKAMQHFGHLWRA